ncbi:glycosyltransferase 87 family protein [Cellulomonas septica]|uniref:DUF2029 domain-containing protein n=1 Tax=Cellulomonas septica TaxID=285080 RepID=A0ABX1JXD0_9CELL|nr:DUF2029 domain-containing protein [Cellulomonas septica]
MTQLQDPPLVDASPEPDGTTWLARETSRLQEARPRLWVALRAVWQRPVLGVVLLAAVTCGALGAVIPDGDAGWFRSAGSTMLGPDVLDVFADGGLQIGPLYLLVLGLATRALDLVGVSPLAPLAAVQAAAIAWFAMWTTRRAARLTGAPVLPAQWAVGLVLSLGGFLAEGIGNGHPEEILIGLVLANAALSAAAGRHVVAALLVGVATGVKQWGLLGGPVVLLGRRVGGTLLGALTAAGVTAALYLPFLLGGDVRTFDMSWGFRNGSLLGYVAGWVGESEWAMRVVQGGIAGLLGALVALRRRGSPLLVVVVVVAARLLLDPMRLTYYAGPLVAVLLVWAWTSDVALVRRWRLVGSLVAPAVVLAPYLLPTTVLWRTGDLLLVAVPVLALVLDRRTAQQPTTS